MTSHAYAKMIRDRELEQAGVRYAWIITHEWEMDDDWDDDLNNLSGRWVPLEKPVTGPFGATGSELLLAAMGTEFRLDYDGDGPAAKGRIWTSDAPGDASESEACFAPQDDYGLGNYGTAHLLYMDPATNDWAIL